MLILILPAYMGAYLQIRGGGNSQTHSLPNLPNSASELAYGLSKSEAYICAIL